MVAVLDRLKPHQVAVAEVQQLQVVMPQTEHLETVAQDQARSLRGHQQPLRV
jgi:hypothetical protein